jgi:hypothetical protein
VTDKARENRARRAADRQGLTLEKSRRRDPRARDFARWWIYDLESGDELLGGKWGVTFDEVETYLEREAS